MPLSPPQIRAAELLAKGHSHQEVGNSVGVSRRTILRWLKQEDFKNLSYGLVGRAAQSPQPTQPQRSSQRRQESGSLTPQDLVEDALLAVQAILQDPEARTCDRLKAAALVGEWSGLSHRGKTAEAEALKVLIEANWVSDKVLETLVDGWAELESRIKNALANGHNGHKKAPLQVSEEGTFDINDDEFDDEE